MKASIMNDDTTARLVRGAQESGSLLEQAAVNLLVAHRYWIGTDVLRSALVSSADSDRIDWTKISGTADEQPASASELQIMLVACELAGQITGASLLDLIDHLDVGNLELVMQAFARLRGWPDHSRLPGTVPGHSAQIVGRFEHEAGML